MKQTKLRIAKLIAPLFCFVTMLSLIACGEDKYPDLEDGLYAEIITNNGTMVTELYFKKTPVTVANFVALAEGNHPMVEEKFKGKKFYNGLTFHRVMDDFMIQGGDPEGTGSGNPGYKFGDEFDPELRHDKPGILSMANSGPNSNGSQFFIIETPQPHLNDVHSVFGELVIGMDVLDSISNVVTAERNKPVDEVVMQEVNIIRKGSDAKNFDAPKVFSEELPLLEERQRKIREEARLKMEEERKAMEAINAEVAVGKKEILDDYKEQGKTLPSGLIVYYLEEGDGPKPNEGQTALVDYEGYFSDGRLFDTSSEALAEEHGIVSDMKQNSNMYRPMPVTISASRPMVPGLKEAFSMLRVGDKAYFYIPSHLAYGEQGAGSIGPNTDLVFIFEMLEIAE